MGQKKRKTHDWFSFFEQVKKIKRIQILHVDQGLHYFIPCFMNIQKKLIPAYLSGFIEFPV